MLSSTQLFASNRRIGSRLDKKDGEGEDESKRDIEMIWALDESK